MRRFYVLAAFAAVSALIAVLFLRAGFPGLSKRAGADGAEGAEEKKTVYREIADVIQGGESLYGIFLGHDLSIEELYSITDASDEIYKLGKLREGRQYEITVDGGGRIQSFRYCIDDDTTLSVKRCEEGFVAEKHTTEYERRLIHTGGVIETNLISAIDDLLLALNLSDVFAWDIDFNTDLRNGDTFKMVVEGFYLEGELKKYGEILSAEFVNNGALFRAYRFDNGGETGYFDDDGKSLKRAFLKAPLSFRRISSGYTQRRYHPVLKRYRPHLGVDYAAPAGTPVTAPASGTVALAGYKGQNGRQIVLRHSNGYTTYYGHLKGYANGIRKGVKVKQGDVIGYVGSTGLSTGPHLDYRIKQNGKFINPLKMNPPRLTSIPNSAMPRFKALREEMGTRLASIKIPRAAGVGKEG